MAQATGEQKLLTGSVKTFVLKFEYFWCTQLALGSRKNVNSRFHIFKRFDSGWSPHQ